MYVLYFGLFWGFDLFRFVYNGIILTIAFYLLFMVVTTWRQIQSLFGMAIFIFMPWITCKYPKQVTNLKYIPIKTMKCFKFLLFLR